MQLDFTRNDLMQEHRNAANERLRAVFTNNPFGLCVRCLRSFVVCEGVEGEGSTHATAGDYVSR
jgi:hypothetical protein